MKKKFTFFLFLLLPLAAMAQNVQVHYDFGRHLYDKDLSARPRITTTVEKFAPDRWGSTFFFVDMDYTSSGIASAYWEISRELKFWQGPLSVHVEYDGGLSNRFSYANAFLLGGTYTYNAPDFKRGFSLTPMYKYIHKGEHTAQFTGTWYVHFKDGLLTFSGFLDLWRQKHPATEKNVFIFLSEPQFWVNLNRIEGVDDDFNLSVGGELELSSNFAIADKFSCIPTIALKWTF
ncbi:hypothetical protein HQ47_00785 [Porphyromonas macacae]|uniref:DUF5020 domain-containing protein n=1 Tax=Porphyromonas macacae TaxID=28115 RepID=A0A0A2EJ25_9PORP|nr:DUF5020 family protein [Porphyromonas macacae]KGN76354.1 hypothetical protein HQ47_00785 [Porphyromonas macacae]SUB89531.1 Uncharacterised protein [Porphyromonas macacae]